ncbi:MAG: hypothetical protein R3362_09920 [Rhodothermales bacterium]|nr:hypothetical protein [Rhodothermales bacterium]
MPARRSKKPPLPSHAVLLLGGLGFLCLMLTAFLVVDFAEPPAPTYAVEPPAELAAAAPAPPRPEAPAEDAAPPSAPPDPAPPPAPAPPPSAESDEPADDEPAPDPAPTSGDEPFAQPDSVATSDAATAAPAAQRRGPRDETLGADLQAFLGAIHEHAGAGNRRVLARRPQFQDLVGRLNASGQRFHVEVFAPDLDSATGRVEDLRALFRAGGLQSDLLALSAHVGSPHVRVDEQA